ncbi:hypothetical protein ACQQCD_11115 [Pseudarthrobacter sp. J1763]|uniref:hypothetical protein n=1 Tax=Pseudarthrobacter sp. J1763 TaxID=3420445 RepID=UPI003D26685D
MSRVRVTGTPLAAHTQGHATSQQLGRDVTELYVASLIRSQLRLALVVAAGFILILMCFGAILLWVPGIGELRIFGIPFPWILLGAGAYPVIGLSAFLFVRASTRNEERYRELVGGK